jgi:hypothetical protein
MKRELRVYNFLDKIKIGISADTGRLNKCEENIFENPSFYPEYDKLITVNQCGDIPIVKDKKYPYLWTQINKNKTDYYRYSTLIRSIIKHSGFNYKLLERTKDNEGVLDIFRNLYCQSDVAERNSLIHASILNIGGQGIVVAGPCRSGKTSLTLSLLKNFQGDLISEGISLLNLENSLKGFYLPRQIYLRFSSILQNPELCQLLTDYDFNESSQYFDHEALHRIIKAKVFDVDAGINISRKKFSEIYKIKTSPSTPITKIIFTEYSKNLGVKKIYHKEALKKLRSREFPLINTFNRVVEQSKIKPPQTSQIKPSWLKNMVYILFSYDSKKHLNKNTLEHLLE